MALSALHRPIALASAAVLGTAGLLVAFPRDAIGAVGLVTIAADDSATETLVESVNLEVDGAGAGEPGVLDQVESSATAEAPEEAPADIALPAAPEAASADAVVVGLTEPLEVPADQVSALGVTWIGGLEGVRVDVRTMVGDTWADWLGLDLEPTPDGEEGAREGTSPFVITESTVVQVRVLTDDGARPDDLRLSLVGVGTEPIPVLDESESVVSQTAADGGAMEVRSALYVEADAEATDRATQTALVAAVSSPVTAARPAIHSRTEWRAAPYRDGSPDITSVLGAVIHHTVSSNDYAQSSVPAMLRSIQAYHQDGRGWSDIGYNFLVDRFGGIWEGRDGGVEEAIRGVHASEANSVSTGISVIGSHDVAAVPTAVRTSLAALIAWKLAIHGVAVGGTFVVGGVVFPNVIGHRDVPSASTACPGSYLYALLPSIRAAAAARQTFRPIPYSRSMSSADAVDVVVTGEQTTLRPIAPEPVRSGVQIGNGWLMMDVVVTSPALRGGSTVDVVARERATGKLYVYYGTGTGRFAGRTAFGTGWNVMEHILAPGDFNGDGLRDLVAIERGTGLMWLYPGNGRLRFGPRKQIGNGWGAAQAVASAGDLTGDGLPDLVAVLGNTVRIYPGNGHGGFLPTRTVGRGPDEVDALFVPGDLTIDGFADIVMRDATTGRMVMLPSTGRARFGAASAWGTGWDSMAALTSGVGWRSSTSGSIIATEGSSGNLMEYSAKSVVTFATAVGYDVDTAAATEVIVAGDVIGSSHADLVTRDADGYLWLHETLPDGGAAEPLLIGNGWSIFTQIIAIGDINVDGAPELLATRTDGRLFVYPFRPDGEGRFEPSYEVGHGFTGYELVASPEWDTDGGSTVLAINSATGALRQFLARGEATLSGGQTIGSGWSTFSDVVAVDNPMSTGVPGLVARQPDGTMWLYLGDGSGGFSRKLSLQKVTVPAGESLR